MKKFLGVFLLAPVIVACSKNVDGTYSAMSSAMFGLATFKVQLVINGDDAKLIRPDGKVLKMKSTVEDERLIVFERKPNDSLVFHLKNDGNTLECNQCEQVGMPKTWEKNKI